MKKGREREREWECVWEETREWGRKEEDRTLVQIPHESRDAIQTPGGVRREGVGSNPRRKSRCDPNTWEREERGRWLQSPTKVEVQSERLEKAGKRTLAPIPDESRGAIWTSRKGRKVRRGYLRRIFEEAKEEHGRALVGKLYSQFW